MIIKLINKWLLVTICISLSPLCKATVMEWQIVPNESSITFTGIQNGAPVTGSFKKFSGVIQFDPKQLNASKVHIVVDINSLATSYNDFTTTLLTSDWFNVKIFPEAIFDANNFIQLANNQYQANATLKIRDKLMPITLSFMTKQISSIKAEVNGNTIIKRTIFGVGQGEWADTEAVKDNVTVNFKITVFKK